jgi:hypothetical protein
MKKIIIASAFVTIVVVSFCQHGFAQTSPVLEKSFKAAFDKYRDAIHRKDNDMLKAAMTPAAYMKAKNEAVSLKRSFPTDFFASMFVKVFSDMDLGKGKTMRAAENGNTGILISFFPKSAKFNPFEPGGDAMVAFFISRYVKEGDVWKYSDASIEGLEDEDEAKLVKGDLSRLDEEKFKASGAVEPVPDEQGPPDYDYDAIININSFGYQTEVTLNGKAIGKTSANLAARAGVKKGENTIVIKSTAVESPDIIRVKILARKNDDAEPVEVFNIELDKPSATVTKTFQVKLD